MGQIDTVALPRAMGIVLLDEGGAPVLTKAAGCGTVTNPGAGRTRIKLDSALADLNMVPSAILYDAAGSNTVGFAWIDETTVEFLTYNTGTPENLSFRFILFAFPGN